jgi:single-strand DNA-binding protein
MLNEVRLLGRLGKKPVCNFSPSGAAYAHLSIATTEYRTDAGGQKTEHTDWHRVTVFGKEAENAAKYLDAGRQVLALCKLRPRSYDKDGEKRYVNEVVADRLVYLGSGKPASERPASEPPPRSFREPPPEPPSGEVDEFGYEDIRF